MMLTTLVLVFFVAVRTTLGSAVVEFSLSPENDCAAEVIFVVEYKDTSTCEKYSGKLFSSKCTISVFVCTGINFVTPYSRDIRATNRVYFHWFDTESCPAIVSNVTVHKSGVSQTVKLCGKESNRILSPRVNFNSNFINIVGNCHDHSVSHWDFCSFTSPISSVYQVPFSGSVHTSITSSPSFITSPSHSPSEIRVSETSSHSSHLDSYSTSSSVILQSFPLSVTFDSSFNPNSYISTSFSTTFLTATPLYYTSMFSPSPSPSSLLYCFAEGNWPLTKAGDTANGTCYKGAFNG